VTDRDCLVTESSRQADSNLKPRTFRGTTSSATTQCRHWLPDRFRPLTADPEHVGGGLVHLDEDSVVDLPQSEELEDLPDLGRHLVDTTDPHDEGQLGLGGDVVVTVLLGITLQPDLVSLLILVLLHVLLGTLEDVDTLLPPVDLGLDGELGPVGSVLSLPLATLENSLWDCGEFSVRHSSLVEVNQAI